MAKITYAKPEVEITEVASEDAIMVSLPVKQIGTLPTLDWNTL